MPHTMSRAAYAQCLAQRSETRYVSLIPTHHRSGEGFHDLWRGGEIRSGKVIRDGMGQSQLPEDGAVDTVITNALILDHWEL